MALARSWLGARRSRCWRIQTLRSSTSGFARSWRTATRSAGILPLMLRSISNNSSIRHRFGGDRRLRQHRQVEQLGRNYVVPARLHRLRRRLRSIVLVIMDAEMRRGP
jgi:hypothetical protein